MSHDTDVLNAGNPDAELIRLCEQHIANCDAVDQENSTIETDNSPVWSTWRQTSDAIGAAKLTTLAGAQAKAKAAMREARQPDGSYNPDGTIAEIWAWDIVNDLLAVGAEQG